jgi:DNA uptake protein ComE-like DNA-binding protein
MMRHAYNRKRRAVILVLSLWMVLVLSLLAYSLAVEMRVEVKLTSAFRDQFRAEQLTRIGVARAFADLRNDRLMDFSRDDGRGQVFDAMGDVWCGSLTPRKYEIKGAGRYDLLVVDEASKFALNSMNPQSRDFLRYLLLLLKVDEKKAQQLVDAIWDWKDSDDKVTGPGATVNDTEVSYYSALAGGGAGSRSEAKSVDTVHPKNGPFNTADELLQIPGMTPELFYGYDPAKEAPPSFFPASSTSFRRKHQPGLRDLVTLKSQSLNLNTAGVEVLSALCACVTKDLSSGRSMAEKIISFRQGTRASSITNNKAFRRVEDLELVSGISSGFVALMKQSVPLLTIQSENFTIYCEAEVGTVSRQVYSSASAKVSKEPLPSSRAVVQCSRNAIVFEPDRFKKKTPPPGCRRATETTPALAGMKVAPATQWFVPVDYVERWIQE